MRLGGPKYLLRRYVDPFWDPIIGLQSYLFRWDGAGCQEGRVIPNLRRYLETYGPTTPEKAQLFPRFCHAS